MSQHPEREILYFPLRGRAEPIRLLLELAGAPYVEKLVPPNEWPKIKPTTPLGQLPVFYERSSAGELVLVQTMAIVRHLARALGLDGATETEHALCDMVAETVLDGYSKLVHVAYSPNFLRNEELTKEYLEKTMPGVIATLEKVLGRGPGTFFVRAEPTYADVLAWHSIDVHLQLDEKALDGHEALRRFYDTVAAIPNLAGYLARRRPTDFTLEMFGRRG